MNARGTLRLSRKTLLLALKAAGVVVSVERCRDTKGDGFWGYRSVDLWGGADSAAAAERAVQVDLRQRIRSRREDEMEKKIQREEEDRGTERILVRVARLPHNRRAAR